MALEAYPTVDNPFDFRAYGALLAAGAWDATPLEINVFGFRYINLYLAYERAAAGGAVQYYFEYSPYPATVVLPLPIWYRQDSLTQAAVVAGAITTTLVQQGLFGYTSVGAGIEAWHSQIVFDLGIGVERMRLFARESGGVAPGNFGVIGYGTRGE